MDKKLYNKIFREYENLRDKNQLESLKRREKIYKEIPEIKTIDETVKSLGIEGMRENYLNPNSNRGKNIKIEIEELRNIKRNMLVKGNYPANYLDEIYKCTNCKDTGFDSRNLRCSCFKQKLANELYKMSNLQYVLSKENFSTFNINVFSNSQFEAEGITPRENMEEILFIVKGFLKEFDSKEEMNLLFYGTTGLGKTFLCNCIAKELLDKNYTVIYQTAFTILDILERKKFNKDSNESHELQYELLFDSDLLIIDDLGTEMANTFTTSEIFNIVNTRIISGKKTIISTNLTPRELSQNYTDRIFSRVFDKFVPIRFFGKDLRWER